MRYHLVRWHERYEKQGLVILEINGGKFEALEEVKRGVAENGVKHPVLWDKDNQNHRNYGIQAWPAAYLLGTEGKVVWEGNPHRLFAGRDSSRATKILEDALKKRPCINTGAQTDLR